jgi:hypothetical protein
LSGVQIEANLTAVREFAREPVAVADATVRVLQQHLGMQLRDRSGAALRTALRGPL